MVATWQHAHTVRIVSPATNSTPATSLARYGVGDASRAPEVKTDPEGVRARLVGFCGGYGLAR